MVASEIKGADRTRSTLRPYGQEDKRSGALEAGGVRSWQDATGAAVAGEQAGAALR
jgi:hypothetical protein